MRRLAGFSGFVTTKFCGSYGQKNGPGHWPGQEIIALRPLIDRKSTRLNSSHSQISYGVFCLKKKNYYCVGLHKPRHDCQAEEAAANLSEPHPRHTHTMVYFTSTISLYINPSTQCARPERMH